MGCCDDFPLASQALGSVHRNHGLVAPVREDPRAADVWEPLLVIADLAGGRWPQLAREAALGVAAGAGDSNPMAVLLFDVFVQFSLSQRERLFSSELVERLNSYGSRPGRTCCGANRSMTVGWRDS